MTVVYGYKAAASFLWIAAVLMADRCLIADSSLCFTALMGMVYGLSIAGTAIFFISLMGMINSPVITAAFCCLVSGRTVVHIMNDLILRCLRAFLLCFHIHRTRTASVRAAATATNLFDRAYTFFLL